MKGKKLHFSGLIRRRVFWLVASACQSRLFKKFFNSLVPSCVGMRVKIQIKVVSFIPDIYIRHPLLVKRIIEINAGVAS